MSVIEDIAVNPWKITERGTKSGTGQIMRVRKIIWYPRCAGDELVITDARGVPAWEVMAAESAPNKESYGKEELDFHDRPFQMEGLIVEKLSGTLYIYMA